jgi:hypothetical protein
MRQFSKIISQAILYTIIFTAPLKAQDSLIVEAKKWSRDANRQIQYSDWTQFPSQTVDLVKNFKQVKNPEFSIYGGDKTQQHKATGFFYTQKIGNRWWLIDPSGCAYISSAVNSVRQGKSPKNMAAFAKTFGTSQKWVADFSNILKDLAFNGTGSWSEVDSFRIYNATHPEQPIVYTTQLSFLSTYAQNMKRKDPSRKEADVLSFIFDPTFPAFCDEHAAKQTARFRNDPNLLGHFSDNELAFMTSSIEAIWATAKPDDAAHKAIADFLKEKNAADIKSLSKADAEAFIGKTTAFYYKTVAEALKKHDPKHLYLGSRLHSSAKNNPSIFKEGAQYLDIISINYYGYWQLQPKHAKEWATWADKPFMITEFYTKAEDSGLGNITGAGWLVHTQADRAIHYQNFCINLLKTPNCVGWHWFRYQDNDPTDPAADPSNCDSNKGIVNNDYQLYHVLTEKMKQLNQNKYKLIGFFDKK